MLVEALASPTSPGRQNERIRGKKRRGYYKMNNQQIQGRIKYGSRYSNPTWKKRSEERYQPRSNRLNVPRNKLRKYSTDVLYYFKRHVDYGELTISNTVNTYTVYNFSLSDLPNSAEFTGLFDMYKVTAVKVTFLPQQTQSISIGTINNPNASSRFFSVIDYNDGTAPSSIDELRQYQTCQFTSVLKPHTRYIPKPKILDTNGFAISPWMSTASPNANYFGLKVAVEPMDSTSTLSMIYTVEVEMYLVFKQVK